MRDFKTLQVWEKAHRLVIEIYQVTANFPKEEMFGLTSQMQRSAASIPTNIAEGCGRGTDSELAHFLQIAMGSASELQYQLILVHDLGFLDSSLFQKMEQDVIEVKKMLATFISKLRSKN